MTLILEWPLVFSKAIWTLVFSNTDIIKIIENTLCKLCNLIQERKNSTFLFGCTNYE